MLVKVAYRSNKQYDISQVQMKPSFVNKKYMYF